MEPFVIWNVQARGFCFLLSGLFGICVLALRKNAEKSFFSQFSLGSFVNFDDTLEAGALSPLAHR